MIYHVLQTVMPRWGYMKRLANDVMPLKIVETDSLMMQFMPQQGQKNCKNRFIK